MNATDRFTHLCILVFIVLFSGVFEPRRATAQACVDTPWIVFYDVLPDTLLDVGIARISVDGASALGGARTPMGQDLYFIWSAGGIEMLPPVDLTLSGTNTAEYGVSANLKYAVGYTSAPTVFKRWDIENHTLQSIPIPFDATYGEADRHDVFGVATDGAVFSTAYWSTDNNPSTYEVYRPHRWTGSGDPKPMGEGNYCLRAISDDGKVAIGSCTGRPERWTLGSNEWKELEGFPENLEFAGVSDMSPDGAFLSGNYQTPDDNGDGWHDINTAFRWSAPDEFVSLEGPDVGGADGWHVIDDGTVFGGKTTYIGGDHTSEPVVWPAGSTSSTSWDAWFAEHGFDLSEIATEGLTATGDGRTFLMQPGVLRLSGGCTVAFHLGPLGSGPGAVSLQAGTPHVFYVNTNGLTSVELSYSLGGSTFSPIGSATVGEPVLIPNPDCEAGEGGACDDPTILYEPFFFEAVAGWEVPVVSSTNGVLRIDGAGIVKDYPLYIQGPAVAVTAPAFQERLFPDSTYQVTWTADPNIDNLDLYFSAEAGNGLYSGFALNVPASAGSHSWTVPDTLTMQAVIRIEDAQNQAVYSESRPFKIKGYELTSVNADTTYERFELAKHAWSFTNSAAALWPQAWWQQFDYENGIDPLTQDEYPASWTIWPFSAQPADFPSWSLVAETFGSEQTYYQPFGEPLFYKPSAELFWSAIKRPWSGSCLGLAVGSLLAFLHPTMTAPTFPELGDLSQIYTLPITDARRGILNRFWTAMLSPDHIGDFWAAGLPKDPLTTLDEIKHYVLEDHPNGRWLYLSNVDGSGSTGAHAVVPFAVIETDSSASIRVYDNNDYNGDGKPDIKDVIVNKILNRWDYAPLKWGGPDRLFLGDFAFNYLVTPAIGKDEGGDPPTTLAVPEGRQHVLISTGADLRLEAADGAFLAYGDGRTSGEIDGGYTLFLITGAPSDPYGFYLADGAYTLEMVPRTQDSLRALVRTSSAAFVYHRTGVEPGQTDRLFWDGGFSATNPDTAPREATLEMLSIEPDRERMFTIEKLTLGAGGTLRAELGTDASLRLQNAGEATSYSLRLRNASEAADRRFQAATTMPIGAGDSHTIVPAWDDAALPVDIHVDADGDGDTDDVVRLSGTIVNVQTEQPAETALPEVGLEPNAPNPFARSTILRYNLSKREHVRLVIFDALGREVARLVDEDREAGRHEVTLDAGDLPSGVYLARLQTPTRVLVRLITRVK
jgi:hypothetical protein